jgi:hypothetical protein
VRPKVRFCMSVIIDDVGGGRNAEVDRGDDPEAIQRGCRTGRPGAALRSAPAWGETLRYALAR